MVQAQLPPPEVSHSTGKSSWTVVEALSEGAEKAKASTKVKKWFTVEKKSISAEFNVCLRGSNLE